MWALFLSLAILSLALAVILAIFGKRISKLFIEYLTPSRVLFFGTILAGVLLFVPSYYAEFAQSPYSIAMTAIMSLSSSAQMVAIDADLAPITDGLSDFSGIFRNFYYFFAIVVYALAPVTSLSVVLSFFKNIAAKNSYMVHYNSDAYVFSELNEKSISLAQSLHSTDKKAIIIFTNTKDNSSELYSKAKAMSAICFDYDIVSVNFSHHNKRKKINFFIIGNNEAENTRIAIALRDEYAQTLPSIIYVFSSNIESEIQLSSGTRGKVIVKRVCDYESLVSHNLFTNGTKLFKNAVPVEGDNEKLISVAIIGFDKYAKAMTKALSWYCQMDGYKLTIDVFSGTTDAEELFSAECPELMSERYNGNFDDYGDARYKITFHDNINFSKIDYTEEISKLSALSYAFVSVGNDDNNLAAAVKLRQLCERFGTKPIIQTIISNSEKKDALQGAKNYREQSYDIDYIGDIKSLYSADTIIGNEITKEALERHKKWGTEESFWTFEYNSKSSIASAIHRRAKIDCKIAGINKSPEERTPEEKYNLRRLEHRRWNAYIRAEGYTYSNKRNDLAKTHNCLVTFDELPLSEKEKDDD